MKKTLLALVAILCLTFAASAADFSGKWVRDPAAAPAGGPPGGGAPGGGAPGGGGGGRGMGGGGGTYEFKVAGAKLTGSITNPGRGGGDPTVQEITDGKVSGDTFSFSVMQPGRGGGDPTKVDYTGKVVGDKLEITTDRGRGPQTTTLVKAP